MSVPDPPQVYPTSKQLTPLLLLNSSASTQASRVGERVPGKRAARLSALGRLLLEDDGSVGQETRAPVGLLAVSDSQGRAAGRAGREGDGVDQEGGAGCHAEGLVWGLG